MPSWSTSVRVSDLGVFYVWGRSCGRGGWSVLTRFSENRRFVELLIKNRSRFEALRDFTIDSTKEDTTFSARNSTETQDDDLASLASDKHEEADSTAAESHTSEQRPLSERARGKQPIHLHSTSTSPHAAEIVQQAPLTSIQANPSFRPTPEWVSSLLRSIPSLQPPITPANPHPPPSCTPGNPTCNSTGSSSSRKMGLPIPKTPPKTPKPDPPAPTTPPSPPLTNPPPPNTPTTAERRRRRGG